MNMWLTDAATVVVGADWTLHPWRHNNVGGVTAGQVRHNSSKVGGSLRARWDDSIMYNGAPLEQVKTFIYLGASF